MNKRVESGIAILLIVGLFALSSGYDFWRGYQYRHSVDDGVIFVGFGFMVLLVVGVVLLLRRK